MPELEANYGNYSPRLVVVLPRDKRSFAEKLNKQFAKYLIL